MSRSVVEASNVCARFVPVAGRTFEVVVVLSLGGPSGAVLGGIIFVVDRGSLSRNQMYAQRLAFASIGQ